MERHEPYLLPLELARGTIVQVRNQLSEWQVIGLSVPAAVPGQAGRGRGSGSPGRWWRRTSRPPRPNTPRRRFARPWTPATCWPPPMPNRPWSSAAATAASSPACSAPIWARTLLDNYTARQFLLTFNAAEVPICWRDVETTEGTLLLDHQRQADRVVPRARAEGPGRAAADARSARPARLALPLRGRFREPAGLRLGVCPGGRRALSRQGRLLDLRRPGQRRRSAVALRTENACGWSPEPIELVRSLDPDTPALVSFDQPWAEYMRQRESDFPPLHFADALVRADLGLGGPDAGDQRRLLARRNAARAPVGVQPPVGHLEPAGAAAVAVALGAQRRITRTRWRSDKIAMPPGSWTPGGAAGVGGPVRAAGAGQAAGAGRALEPTPRQPSRTTSRTAACSTSAAKASPRSARWPRSGRRC